MNFSALGSAWLFALLVPLIIFYFLKLRRPRQTVSSLVLWRQVLSDQRVNSPFQRFKRNLLLLLQILLLALLAFAAMQPFLRRESTRTDRLPILVDVSASMGALDKDGGRSRLEEAKARLRERIAPSILRDPLGRPGGQVRGEVSEWLKEHAWKVCKRLIPASRVRIPPSPPVLR